MTTRKYEEFLENYSPEMQLWDALDDIKHFCPNAAEILNRWVSQTNNEKTDVESPQSDPTH
jgi:hypothetical protein